MSDEYAFLTREDKIAIMRDRIRRIEELGFSLHLDLRDAQNLGATGQMEEIGARIANVRRQRENNLNELVALENPEA